ncbi:MAG: competence/damage-inducible protein A [Candidatus Asgardarchaeia archaeon]
MYVEIIVIGNEIMSGHTLDTNSNWLCKKLTELGAVVRLIIKVPDIINEISNAFKYCMNRRPDLIISTGGLGPTFDDKTAEALALALSRKLVLNEDAYKMIESRYEDFYRRGIVESPEMNESRKKMAFLPEGAIPLENSIGAAPGILVEKDGIRIVALPGVPKEMIYIFKKHIAPFVKKEIRGEFYMEKEVEIDATDETLLAPLIDEVMERVKGVYIKSHPSVYGSGVKIRVNFSCRGKEPKEVEAKLEKAAHLLEELWKRKRV